MSAWESKSVGSLSGNEQQVDTSRFFRRQPMQTSIEASFAFDLGPSFGPRLTEVNGAGRRGVPLPSVAEPSLALPRFLPLSTGAAR
jgi:hypothetical protein